MEIKYSNVTKNFRRLKLIGIALITIILLTLVSGFLYEHISYKNVKTNFPPDGKMIDVGGRDIHVNIQGEKTNLPPVVIEAGAGSWSDDWSYVQKELSKHTEVITYDRAGLGWSEPPPNGYSIDTTINDLSKILEYSNIDTPVILVGHSLGGLYTRLFTDKYPDKVSGLVLVDARNEYFTEKATTFNDVYFESQDQAIYRILSQFGIIRLFGEGMLGDAIPDYLSAEKQVNVQYDSDFFKITDEEFKQLRSLEKLLKDTQHLDDKPLLIITLSDTDREMILGTMGLGFSEEEAIFIDQQWKDAQKQQADITNNSELILVPNSGHNMMFDQPDAIIEAILKMAGEL
ncbi:alpha/beta hydrolase [Cytobacillus sp. IB215665]|uniref:alpha/beta fold hydrolase n=1 Tax=Cytobacillus sp. IB215665 TaxID=3097357 RepID=UPI002A171405|nr:alpha/beta hydrolase [Cytobacillus sp. IB215665]MDX8366113.1 alpha/beta hydrolase [Cytobacillus sp. IB215665]